MRVGGGQSQIFLLGTMWIAICKKTGLIGGEEVFESGRNHKLSFFSLLKRPHFYSNSWKKIYQNTHFDIFIFRVY